jgi:hypothetical protein
MFAVADGPPVMVISEPGAVVVGPGADDIRMGCSTTAWMTYY